MSDPATAPSRRRFLQGTGGVAAGWALAGHDAAPAHAEAAGTGAAERTTTFAFITDAHYDPEYVDRSDVMRAVFTAIADADPTLVINSGDVADTASPYQYRAYCDLVPASLRHKIVHVPGNHDARHDATVYGNYDRFLGNDEFGGVRNSSVTVDGLHFCLLDTTVTQQSTCYASEADLRWLRRDLERDGRNRPTIVVTHHPPIGEDYYFLKNSEDFVDTIEPYRVRAVLCGHMHKERVRTCNGLTVVSGADLKKTHDKLGYYLLTRTETASSDLLKVEFISVSLDGRSNGPLARPELPLTIDLGSKDGPGDDVGPSRVTAQPTHGGSALRVRADFDDDRHVATVSATLYKQDILVGRHENEVWTPLQRRRPRGYESTLPIDELPPGEHRVIVRVTDSAGHQWREIRTFEKKGHGFAPLWHTPFGGMIHSALAQHGDLVVAGSSTGTVTAFSPRGGSKRRRWRAEVGPVYAKFALSADASTVYAASSDHHVYALSTGTGRRRWRSNLGAPVMADPLATRIGGAERLLVFAGDTLCCLDAVSGHTVWRERKDAWRPSMGRVACDGERVYLGNGDGHAYVIDAGDRHTVWREKLTTRTDTHGEMTKGPWDCQVLLVGDVVIFGTNRHGFGFRRDGTPLWEMPGSWIFCPPVQVGAQVLMVASGKPGDPKGPVHVATARLVDPSTGKTQWETTFSADLKGPGIALTGDKAYVTASTGSVHQLDLATGDHREVRQMSKVPLIATPVLCDEGRVFVAGTIDGMLRAFRT